SYERAAAAGELRTETKYALLAFGRHGTTPDAVLRELERQLPAPDAATDYLELELAQLPEIAKPRVEPKRLSTGQMALEIASVGDAWRIRCTGCGESS